MNHGIKSILISLLLMPAVYAADQAVAAAAKEQKLEAEKKALYDKQARAFLIALYTHPVDPNEVPSAIFKLIDSGTFCSNRRIVSFQDVCLHVAARSKDPFKPLISSTPLIEAAARGNLAVVNAFVAQGANVNGTRLSLKDGKPGANALEVALDGGKNGLDVAAFLLAQGSELQNTPHFNMKLMQAAQQSGTFKRALEEALEKLDDPLQEVGWYARARSAEAYSNRMAHKS